MSAQTAPATRLVQIRFIIPDHVVRRHITRNGGMMVMADAAMWPVTAGRSNAQPEHAFVVLKLSLSFFVGVVVGCVFCDRLFPLPVDLDRIVDVIFGFINSVSSVQLKEWLAIYVVGLLTFMVFLLRAQYVRAM